MPETAPHQLFDGSFFEAIVQSAPPKNTPPAPEIESETPLPDFQSFDWDAYNREFYSRLPDSLKGDEQGREMAAIAGVQLWMSQQFPPPVLAWLVSNVPVKRLWSFLSQDDNRELLQSATRGFQRTPAIVRQPIVRGRIAAHLQKNPKDGYVVMMLWGLSDPPPPIIALAKIEDDGAPVRDHLPGWIAKFGIEGTIAGLAMAGKPRTMARLLAWLKDPTELMRVVEEARQEPEPEAAPALSPPSEDEHAPDSDAARFWKTKCQEAEARDAQRAEMLGKMLDVNEGFIATVARQKAELEALQKREKSALQTLEKKLAGTQKRAQTELEELKKGFERQTRKLRALERDHETLDSENRRFKKQLRRAGLLLEEERRKVAALEAAQAAPQAVEAISTPVSKQSAPGKPIVVQAPTPLDEIFEWRADGRAVKITARAVRRLIDQNDEEAVYGVIQALDALETTNPSLHGKFLKRIGDTGPYYARVLRENMTRVLVDASNVARYAPNKYGKGQLRHLTGMREELRRLGCFPLSTLR